MKKGKIILVLILIISITFSIIFANKKTDKKPQKIVKETYSSYAIGDADGNGNIDITDVSRLYRYVKGIITLTAEEKQAGDITGDGKIEIDDVSKLYRYIKGIGDLSPSLNPNVYTSDNIASGNTHDVGFLLKIKSGNNTVYYCEDTDNTCSPNTTYTSQLRYATSTTKYLRYKACNSANNCSSVKSYKVVLSIVDKNPSVSSSGGMANPHQAAYYSQTSDSRWKSYQIPVSPYGSVASRGCGYTSMAMLITALTHDYSVTPKTVITTLANSGEKYYYSSSESPNCGGCMYHYAAYNKSLTSKYKYSTFLLWSVYDWNNHKDWSKTDKQDALVESLQMGHVILLLIPNHYVALVGINSSNQIYAFNPDSVNDSGYTTWKSSVGTIYDHYYNYRNRCNNSNNCNLQVVRELYKEGGYSLDEWRALGK